MAARDSASLTRNDYLALFYALQELRSEPANLQRLKSHISSGRFYNYPLTSMVRNMQLLLQSKDPNRKFPQTLRKEDVPEYFESLLREVNSQTEHDFYGHIERGIKQNIWENIPVPVVAPTPTTPTPPIGDQIVEPVIAEGQEEKPTVSPEPKEPIKRFKASAPHPAASPPQNTPSTPPQNQKVNQRSFFQRVLSSVSGANPGTSPTGRQTTTTPQITNRNNRVVTGQLKQAADQLLGNPIKNIGSQITRQIIRHPLLKKRAVTAVIGAIGGYYFGGAPGAGVGAVLGGLLGPNISSGLSGVLTGGRNISTDTSSTNTGGDDSGGASNSGGGGGSTFFRNRALSAARNLASQAARRAVIAGGRSFLAANAWWIILVIIIVVIVLIALLMMLCVIPWSGCSDPGAVSGQSKNISIEKSAPRQVENGASIEYKITVTNKGTVGASVLVSDQIPENTIYENGDNDPLPEGTGVKKLTWDIKSLSPKQSKTLSFKVKPAKENTWVINQATADVAFSMAYGNSTGLLPTPLTSEIGNWAATRDMIIEAVNKHPEVVEAYKKAGSLTGVPWEVLAGLHFVETGNDPRPSASLVSGRAIGVREPDIPPSACAAGITGPGTPIPLGGGCGFSNFEDSAIYAAKHIMGKNGDKPPTTFEEAVTSLSRYNGGGNRNCGRGVPYNYCPRDFEGEDDPYSMNYFDQKHAEMYLIYCGDGTQCSPFRPFARPGSMAVIRALLGK